MVIARRTNRESKPVNSHQYSTSQSHQGNCEHPANFLHQFRNQSKDSNQNQKPAAKRNKQPRGPCMARQNNADASRKNSYKSSRHGQSEKVQIQLSTVTMWHGLSPCVDLPAIRSAIIMV